MSDEVDIIKTKRKFDNFLNKTVSNVRNAIENEKEKPKLVGTFENLLTTPIGSYCLIEMGNYQRKRLFQMSLIQKNTTLESMFNSVSSTTNKVSDDVFDYLYSYAEDNNYLIEFQKKAKDSTTRNGWYNDTTWNYVNHNQLYGQTENLYYDDTDSGTDNFRFSQKTENYEGNRNENSIIKKTKDLFKCRKLSTIISRFHTDPSKVDLYSKTESATSKYGLSHGRNLLTYDAEKHGAAYNRNGYDNPYCRVWTHHFQYDEKRANLIRPFSQTDENGKISVTKNTELHHWSGFKNEKDWSWKDDGASAWEKSVLNNRTGTLNIAPKFLGGAEKNIHTKDCMFSIENLAWQGYDPYSFEQALSWEQRGPFGGRIMWFPPYGLNFSENVSVQWSENAFIGRGENVYTYNNTTRSGTLSFMLVVDHPSIVDYATWHEDKPKDTDILRFFAGCDPAQDGSSENSDGNNNGDKGNENGGGSSSRRSLVSYVRPTPLTDEYLDDSGQDDGFDPGEQRQAPDENPLTVEFMVFYPNNYSGYYDNNETSKVEPIAYLLKGKGSQWKYNDTDATKSEELPITCEDIIKGNNTFFGNGYEMSGNGISVTDKNEKNYIVGSKWGTSKYVPDNAKIVYYRMDGEYKPVKYDEIKNTFSQNLIDEEAKKDRQGFSLNANAEEVKKAFPEIDEEIKNSKTTIFSSLKEMSDILFFSNKAKVDKKKEEDTKKIEEVNNKKKDINGIKKSITTLENKISVLEGIYKEIKEQALKIGSYSTIISFEKKNIKDNDEITYVNGFIEHLNNVYNLIINSLDKSTFGIEKLKVIDSINLKEIKKSLKKIKNKKIKENGEASMKLLKTIIDNNNSNSERNIKLIDNLNSNNISIPDIRKDIDFNLKITNRKNEELNSLNDSLKKNNSEQIEELFYNESYELTALRGVGYSNAHGKNNKVNKERNDFLAKERCRTAINWFLKYYKGRKSKNVDTPIEVSESGVNNGTTDGSTDKEKYDVSKLSAKKWRSAKITLVFSKTEAVKASELKNYQMSRFIGLNFVRFASLNGKEVALYSNPNEQDRRKIGLLWYYDEETKQMRLYDKIKKSLRNTKNWTSKEVNKGDYNNFSDVNNVRYDQEYYFFKELEAKHPMVHSSLVEKLQYFDPAFHSMTPEGFMGRLNFLHQCTRQGNTHSASDKNGHSANNLAFGRPPFCVLRIGDFYYQKIVITNLSISYGDQVQLDLNNEGAGVVPLIAYVNLSFNFIGGGDMAGAVRRLQNANSFNYYANGRLYDNRADRVEYENTNWETMGGNKNNKIDFKNSYFYEVAESKKK